MSGELSKKMNKLDFQGISFQIPEGIRPHITQSDVDFVLEEALREHKKEHIDFITISIKEGYLGYVVKTIPFDRIRRITGYLVGTTDRWNNAKQQELKERVKHDTKRRE